MIAAPAPLLAPVDAARQLLDPDAGGFWIASPLWAGAGRELIAGAPARVVTGTAVGDLARLDAVWREARAAWADGGTAPSGVPVGGGWFSYELGRRLVGLPPDPRADGQPLFRFHFPDAIWARGNPREAMLLARDQPGLDAARARLARPLPPAAPARLGRLRPVHPDGHFLDGVRRIRAYEEAGDTYQVNLSRRLTATLGGEAARLADDLRAAAPAPFAALFACGAESVVGNSPELFLAVTADGTVETRPIKGTRPRGASPAEDRAAVADLLASPKDRAEHVMIVDLERNDLGRVCRTGSVQVAELARLVSLPTVHHLESTVRGALRPGVGLTELLAATFPGGSITGAPKRRAMQIIDELEPVPRGVYTGATGWLGAAGDLELAVAIRTATLSAGRLTLSVGGGIVIDSSPEAELAETEVKARAFAALARGGPPA